MIRFHKSIVASLLFVVLVCLSLFLYSCGITGPGGSASGNNGNTTTSPHSGSPWITLTAPTTSIAIGGSVQFKGTYYNADGSIDTTGISNILHWYSSDTAIVTIDSQGIATGIKRGVASVSANYGGISSVDIILSVGSNVQYLGITPASAVVYLRIPASTSQQFLAPAVINGISQDVTYAPTTTWKISDPTLASINFGRVQGISKPGNVTITVNNDTVTSLPADLLIACREYHYFNQLSAPWGTSFYDHSTAVYNTIGDIGCALTSTSMLMSSLYGLVYDPDVLNTIYSNNPQTLIYSDGTPYIDSFGYSDGAVKWYATSQISNYQISTPSSVFWGTNINSFDVPIPMSYLDLYIDKCDAVIVGVRRRSPKYMQTNPLKTHYILVTGKIGNTYTVLDPAYSDLQTLDRYGVIYQIIGYSVI